MGEKNIILAINSGSSSLKATLFQIKGQELQRLLDAHFKHLNSKALLKINSEDGQKETSFQKQLTVSDALKYLFQMLKKDHGTYFSLLRAVGHRFVHGGEYYQSSQLINQKILQTLARLSEWAPLHNRFCFEGIQVVNQEIGESIPQVVVFDTTFYADLPQVAAHYALPHSLVEKHGIKRYGFHGISHEYLWRRYSETNVKAKQKIVTLHLGNGCSITAIKEGRPLDTSMGFSPLEGLVMGTRSGDIDPSVVEFICDKEKMSPQQVLHLLNFESGLWGICGISDMGELSAQAGRNEKAQFALDLFCYRILKYLAAYVAVLNGADALVFSGGIGENSPEVRARIISLAKWLKVELDQEANQQVIGQSVGTIKKISSLHSLIDVLVIATDENALIAREALSLVSLKKEKK